MLWFVQIDPISGESVSSVLQIHLPQRTDVFLAGFFKSLAETKPVITAFFAFFAF